MTRRYTKLILLSGVLIVVGAVLLAVFTHKLSQDQKTEKLVTQASSLLDAASTTKLSPIVSQIKLRSGYAQNPDCLYVLTMYDINSGNLTAAKQSYSQFVTAYNKKGGYGNNQLRVVALSPKALQMMLSVAQTQADEAKANFFGAGVPNNP